MDEGDDRKVVFAAAESLLVKCFIPANLEERHTAMDRGRWCLTIRFLKER